MDTTEALGYSFNKIERLEENGRGSIELSNVSISKLTCLSAQMNNFMNWACHSHESGPIYQTHPWVFPDRSLCRSLYHSLPLPGNFGLRLALAFAVILALILALSLTITWTLSLSIGTNFCLLLWFPLCFNLHDVFGEFSMKDLVEHVSLIFSFIPDSLQTFHAFFGSAVVALLDLVVVNPVVGLQPCLASLVKTDFLGY
jgi:hypothetical protein